MEYFLRRWECVCFISLHTLVLTCSSSFSIYIYMVTSIILPQVQIPKPRPRRFSSSGWISLGSMVKRSEKKVKFKRWCIYFSKDSRLPTWKKILGQIIAKGNACVDFRQVSECKVELIWPTPVTVMSVQRLIRKASEQCTTFKIVDNPQGIDDEGDNAATSAAAAAGGDEESSASPVELEHTPGKRQRGDVSEISPSTAMRLCSASFEPASSATGSRSGGFSWDPSEETIVLTRALVAIASPGRLLSLKVENLGLLFSIKGDASDLGHQKYDVSRDKMLGQGAYAKVFVGTTLAGGRPVALKLFPRGRDPGAPVYDAEMEVRRFCALPPHPNIVRLLDVQFFPQRAGGHAAAIGLVFELFDTDGRQFLKKMPMKIAGARHLLRGLLAALACMHAVGLVHADVKPANILLRGAGPFRQGFQRMLAAASGAATCRAQSSGGEASGRLDAVNNEALEVTHHLPQSFEVGVGLGVAVRQ